MLPTGVGDASARVAVSPWGQCVRSKVLNIGGWRVLVLDACNRYLKRSPQARLSADAQSRATRLSTPAALIRSPFENPAYLHMGQPFPTDRARRQISETRALGGKGAQQ